RQAGIPALRQKLASHFELSDRPDGLSTADWRRLWSVCPSTPSCTCCPTTARGSRPRRVGSATICRHKPDHHWRSFRTSA
ncbi:hypothetical protein QNM99_18350, partial [Pseudomonas sp. PCH446]